MRKNGFNYTRGSLLLATLVSLLVISNSSMSNKDHVAGVTDMPHIESGMSMQTTHEQKLPNKHVETVYACPMHPEETSHEAGSCSKCGMFLVAQTMQSMQNLEKSPQHAGSDSKEHNMDMMSKTAEKTDNQPLYWDNSNQQEAQRDDVAETHNHQHASPRLQPTLPPISTISKADTNLEPAENSQKTSYICPMHPQIIQHEPGGNCPICGMNLVAKNTTKPSSEMPQVFLSAAVIQNMGIRTAKVELKTINKQIHTQGLVTADNDRLLSIHPRTAGWIEILHLINEGDRVERKEVLVDFYSPWINQVQLDYISALEEYDLTSFDPNRKAELAAKLESLSNSLRMLNVMDMDIMRIKNTRKVQNTIQLMAPQGGIVTRLNINEGSYVEPYQSMFTIVDLSKVWVMVDIYEHQAPWVKKGNIVNITAPAIPEKSWDGVVDFIYPQVNQKTRTLRARIVVPNPDEALLLNMYVKVDISVNSSNQAVLTVPREAVITTGERESVIKVLEKGHFQPVQVKTGKRAEGRIQILSGLQAGEDIVVSGQFLIDSESSLQASFLRLSE